MYILICQACIIKIESLRVSQRSLDHSMTFPESHKDERVPHGVVRQGQGQRQTRRNLIFTAFVDPILSVFISRLVGLLDLDSPSLTTVIQYSEYALPFPHL
jgi:hypothetical protein